MKIISTTEYYKCEYCNKIYVRKYACIKHEQICTQNPTNMDACLGCKNCNKIDITIDNDFLYGGKIKTHYFKCNITGKSMYPYASIRKGLTEKYPEQFDEQERMPIKCDMFTIID